MTLLSSTMASPVGQLTLVARGEALAAVLWPRETPGRVSLGETREARGHPVLAEAERQLQGYFDGHLEEFDLPLDPAGTTFQQQVWLALRAIPFGATRSYAQIARAVGRPSATRAVGAANGRNPLSIIVPCHRVIGSSGALTGFGGGLQAKTWLLAHERRAVEPDLWSLCSQADQDVPFPPEREPPVR